MKKFAVGIALLAAASLGTAAHAQGVEQQLRDLKRLRDSGLISDAVYAEQQRRILEAPAPAAPAAAAAAQPNPVSAPVVQSAAPGLPAVGASWNYRLQDRLFPRRQQTFAVTVGGLNGPLVNELVQAGEGERVAQPVDAQVVRFVERDLGGQRFVEMSPYILAAVKGGALPNPPTHYPLGGSSEPFRVRLGNIIEDNVNVPAGSFKAIRIDVTGERSAGGFLGLGGGQLNTLAVTRFKYTAWYAPELGRYVMVRHQQWNPTGSPVTDEVVQLVSYGAK